MKNILILLGSVLAVNKRGYPTEIVPLSTIENEISLEDRQAWNEGQYYSSNPITYKADDPADHHREPDEAVALF